MKSMQTIKIASLLTLIYMPLSLAMNTHAPIKAGDAIEAAQNGCVNRLAHITKNKPALLEEIDENGRNILHIALLTNQHKAFCYLIEQITNNNQLNLKALVNSANPNNKRTPLHEAAANGDTCAIKKLVQAGAYSTLPDWCGDTPRALFEQTKQQKWSSLIE